MLSSVPLETCRIPMKYDLYSRRVQQALQAVWVDRRCPRMSDTQDCSQPQVKLDQRVTYMVNGWKQFEVIGIGWEPQNSRHRWLFSYLYGDGFAIPIPNACLFQFRLCVLSVSPLLFKWTAWESSTLPKNLLFVPVKTLTIHHWPPFRRTFTFETCTY